MSSQISVAVLQDSVQVAMEMGRMQVAVETSRMPLEEWRTQDAALSQKALLQDELVTIRARMCDVSLVGCEDLNGLHVFEVGESVR